MALTLTITSYQSQVLGPDGRREFGKSGGSIGRAQGNDWVLPDPERYISGQHFTLSYNGNAYYLTDTSTNGVFINQQTTPVGNGNSVQLNEGDHLDVGDYEIIVSIDDDAENVDSLGAWPSQDTIADTNSFAEGGTNAGGFPESSGFNVFISYSHKDEVLKDQLLEHVSSLRREGLINIWHDRDIDAGDYWINEIDNHIEIASIILLLVTPSFIASSYCHGVELERALELASAEKVKIIPVILRPVDWQSTDFGRFQALPMDGRAVTSWENQDEAFLQVAMGIRSAINSLSVVSSNAAAYNALSAQASPKMRFYLYISDSKINMLFPQIPHDIKSDTLKSLGFDRLGHDADTDRIYKLEAVNRFIRERHQVGSIAEPMEYIAGTLTLSWGCTYASSLSRVAPHEDNPFVFFTGQQDSTTLLMSGSTKHLIGDHKPRERGCSSSSIPHVIESLMKDIELERKDISAINVRKRIAPYETDQLPYSGEELALAIVDEAGSHLSSTRQRLEFLAITLINGRSPTIEGHNSLLASPLYVALAM